MSKRPRPGEDEPGDLPHVEEEDIIANFPFCSTASQPGDLPPVEDDDEEVEDVIGPSQTQSSLASQPLRQAGSSQEGGEVGIVESITLKNFMCHSLLGPFTFGSNVNFVIGNNGSGKSAVLTALIVALGGNAQATNRGSSLKEFVKDGESSADVSITLRNRGQDAYRPEVYGSSITVDVKITREGARIYKVKSKSGNTISSKKEELLALLDNFNIQVDNPVSILTQEMSKHFLHSKGEGDKYKFFMKATQLEKMQEGLVHIKQTKDITLSKIEQHSECLAHLRHKYREKEEQYKSLASLDEMNNKLNELAKMMAWAMVSNLKQQLQPLKDKLQADQGSTANYDEKVQDWKNKVAEAEQKFKQIQEQVEGITQRHKDLQPQCAELKAKAQQKNNHLKSGEVCVHRYKATMKALEKDKAQLSKRIEELNLSISNGNEAESQARATLIEQHDAQLESLRHQDSTLDQQINQYQQAINLTKDELGQMKRGQDTLHRAIEVNVKNLQTMEGSRSNRLRRFGERIPAFLNTIQEAYMKGQFVKKPCGPLGYCIALKDPEMALAVEICLKGQLQAFACDNYDDEKVLKGLMVRAFPGGRRPNIITSTFIPQVHNTSRRAVNYCEYPSVLQSLEIEDPVVANCLIDQRGIESVLLIKDKTEARRVMQGRQPPANCSMAITKEGDQIFPNRAYTAEQDRAKYLSGDVEEEIRHLGKEVENQKVQAARFQNQMATVDRGMKQNEALLKQALVEQKNVKERARKLQFKLNELQNVEEPQSEDLKPLEEDLEEIMGKICSTNGELKAALVQMGQLKTSYEEAEQEYNQHKEQINGVSEEVEKIKEELSVSDQEVAKCKHHLKHYQDKRKGHIKSIQDLKDSLNIKEQELQEAVAKATEMCPERLEVNRTLKSLDTEISRLRLKITSKQDQQGNREEIVRQYHEASQDYKTMSQHVKSLNKFIQTMDGMVTLRIEVYDELRSVMALRCKCYFDSMLGQRGYTGTMAFDHKKETLTVSVQPGQGDKANLSDMRSLSGGERSFSTVCFVLSLWAITEAPFRCLDEFDVFMDMVNRRISMDMMLKVATSQWNRQFIFLTPQSMSSIPTNRLIHIHRLNDPDRGQQSCGPRDEEEETERP